MQYLSKFFNKIKFILLPDCVCQGEKLFNQISEYNFLLEENYMGRKRYIHASLSFLNSFLLQIFIRLKLLFRNRRIKKYNKCDVMLYSITHNQLTSLYRLGESLKSKDILFNHICPKWLIRRFGMNENSAYINYTLADFIYSFIGNVVFNIFLLSKFLFIIAKGKLFLNNELL